MIRNQEKVIDYFGYWPKFCDAKFKSFLFEKSGVIETTIYYIDSDTSKKAQVSIKFSGVTDMKLNDFMSENVIDEISITDKSPYMITIDACYGLNGRFKCTDIEVTNVGT